MPETQEKRNRAPNYTHREKSILFEIIEDFQNIIENKKTDFKTCKEKDQTWDRITKVFNFRSKENIRRNKESLKKMYENSKKMVKKQIEEGRRSSLGAVLAEEVALEVENDKCKEMILSIISQAGYLNNQYEGDSQNSNENKFIPKGRSSFHHLDEDAQDTADIKRSYSASEENGYSENEEECVITASRDGFKTATTPNSKRRKVTRDYSESAQLKMSLFEKEKESIERRIVMEEELHELKKRKLLLEIKRAELEIQRLKET